LFTVRDGTRRLKSPKHGDSLGISTECRDVVTGSFQSHALIEHTCILRSRGVSGHPGEFKDVFMVALAVSPGCCSEEKHVLEADYNNTLRIRYVLAVADFICTVSSCES